ncbi:hypothetical protein FQN54_002367 [Arachnomyces sp. PD_36]|nr:hypothetical protein FQN54_002367 [Arachnomyces sp. PD_36]
MQPPGPISDVVAPPMKDLEWESHSVASTPLPDQNLGLLVPQEDTRPRPRSAGGSNRPTKSEEVVELVQFLETHDGPDTEPEQEIPQQGSRSYNIARGLFKAGHRRLRQLNKPRSDPWVKRETAGGRTYRSIAVPNRISLLGNQGIGQQRPELPDIGSLNDGAPVMTSGNGNSDSVFSGPPFLGEITHQEEEDMGNPGDRFYPGIGELPSVIGFSLPLPTTRAVGENGSHEITEPQLSLRDSTPAQQSEFSDSERTVARVRFDVGTISAVANETVSRHDSATINGVKNNDEDRHELETQSSEVSISPPSEGHANFSTPFPKTTKNRADSADSAESSYLDQDASFHTRSSESSTSVSAPKSIIRGTSRCSPSPRSSSRQLNPRTSLQSIHEKSTWRGPTVILQRKSSRGLLQDRWSKPPSSPAQQQTPSVENVHTTSLLEKYLLPNGMTSSPLMPAPTGSVAERAQSHYTFPDLEIDDNKNSPASTANDIPYNGSPRSPPRPAPTKPLPSLPKNKASRSSSYNRDNDIEARGHAQPNGSHSNAETTTPRSSSRQGKLPKSPSRSIRRSRSALSRSHIKLHEGPNPGVSTADRTNDRESQQTSSAPSMHERKLSAERRERISRAERVYAVRMKDICAARARLENKMLEVREAGGDAMADEFTFSDTRLLDNRDAGVTDESEPNANDNQSTDRAGRNNDQNQMFSPRLPSVTPSPPPKVPLPADPPHSLLSAFSIESILRGSSKPPHRSMEISPITTVYEQRPSLDNLPSHSGLYRSNSKAATPDNNRRYHEQTSLHRDTHVSHPRWDKPPKTLPRSSTVLTNGKATPPRSTSPSLTSLDDEQAGRVASAHPTSGQEWNPPFHHNPGYIYGTPERQPNGETAFTPMTAVHRDDYIPPLSPRVRSNHSRTKISESHLPESRHHQPTSHPQQQNTNNTVQTLESRVALLERQNKMLQAALMSALDVGVTLDAENVRSGTPVRTAATSDGYDVGNIPNPRLKRHSGIIPRRPNSWLSVRSAQSRMSVGATSSGSEGAGVKAIEAMIGNLELGWSGDRQSVGDHGEPNTTRDRSV